MNGLRSSLTEVSAVADAVARGGAGRAEVAVCLPFTLLISAADVLRGPSSVSLGGQDCATAASGAFTGDISAEMLKDAGASIVIVGHSERRAGHGERDDLVRAKAEAAFRAGLSAIICVGETRAEREGGETLRVIGRQIDDSVPQQATGQTVAVAYEPVWAIGTGVLPSDDDVAEVHNFIRRRLAGLPGGEGEKVRVLYGGSVNPGNARQIAAIANVDGVLVGGASLISSDFMGVADAYR